MATNLIDAFASLKTDKAMARAFAKDPEPVLQSLGVNTKKLQITKGFRRGQGPGLALPPGSAGGITICASIGWIVCASVGGEVDI